MEHFFRHVNIGIYNECGILYMNWAGFCLVIVSPVVALGAWKLQSWIYALVA